MPLNFDLLGGSSLDSILDPREMFQALPQKAVQYKYLRDVQGEVLEKWSARRSERDFVLKMNTGAGKTVVGLLILRASLNEGIGPAVYIAPDGYLAKQALSEAKALGIAQPTTRNQWVSALERRF